MKETSLDAPLDSQETIGQRIKFLLDELKISIRKLARTLDVSDTNIRNYIERGSKPGSDVLEKMVRSFPQINSLWLITGEGEPFLSTSDKAAPLTIDAQKIFRSPIIGNNQGTANQQQHTASTSELATAYALIEQLKSQLQDKERIIKLLEKNA